MLVPSTRLRPRGAACNCVGSLATNPLAISKDPSIDLDDVIVNIGVGVDNGKDLKP